MVVIYCSTSNSDIKETLEEIGYRYVHRDLIMCPISDIGIYIGIINLSCRFFSEYNIKSINPSYLLNEMTFIRKAIECYVR